MLSEPSTKMGTLPAPENDKMRSFQPCSVRSPTSWIRNGRPACLSASQGRMLHDE
jgi:hypothetical protein